MTERAPTYSDAANSPGREIFELTRRELEHIISTLTYLSTTNS